MGVNQILRGAPKHWSIFSFSFVLFLFFFLFVTEKMLKHWKRWFRLGNGVPSTHLLADIHNREGLTATHCPTSACLLALRNEDWLLAHHITFWSDVIAEGYHHSIILSDRTRWYFLLSYHQSVIVLDACMKWKSIFSENKTGSDQFQDWCKNQEWFS